jgi:hypothetical protein
MERMDENPYEWPPIKRPTVLPSPIPVWRRRVAILIVCLGLFCFHLIPEVILLGVRRQETEMGLAAAFFYLALGCFLICVGAMLVPGSFFRKGTARHWLGIFVGLMLLFVVFHAL